MTFRNHLLEDLVALFAWRGLESMTSNIRCLRCSARLDSFGSQLPCISSAEYVFPSDPLLMHVEFGLHFLTNWAIRMLRVVEGYCVAISGWAEVFYAAFDRKFLEKGLGVLGQHVDKLRDILPLIASHVDFPI